MFHTTPLAFCLFAVSIALRAASAPVSTSATLLIPYFGPTKTDPLATISEVLGAGTDGRTTYVATLTTSGAAEMITYALGPSDFVEQAVIVESGSYGALTVNASEACTFTGGATAGAVATCVVVEAAPLTTLSVPATVTLEPVLLKTNGAAATTSAGFLLSAVIGIAVISL